MNTGEGGVGDTWGSGLGCAESSGLNPYPRPHARGRRRAPAVRAEGLAAVGDLWACRRRASGRRKERLSAQETPEVLLAAEGQQTSGTNEPRPLTSCTSLRSG